MSRSSKRIFCCKLKTSKDGSSLHTKFVSANKLEQLQQQQNDDLSTIYFGDFDPVQEYQYDKIKTLTLFAASPRKMNQNMPTAFHVVHPHLDCKPLRVMVVPGKHISVDVWSEDNPNGKMFHTLKRWKWCNLSNPRKGFAVAVFRRTLGTLDEYRFKIHCHVPAEDERKVKQHPIKIANPSLLRRIHRKPAKMAIQVPHIDGSRTIEVRVKSIAIFGGLGAVY